MVINKKLIKILYKPTFILMISLLNINSSYAEFKINNFEDMPINRYEYNNGMSVTNILFKNQNQININSVELNKILNKNNKINYYGNKIEPELYYKKHDEVNIVLANYIVSKYKNINKNNAKKIIEKAFIEGNKKNIDPILLLSIIEKESSFNANAKNKSTASGLMQIVPKYHKKTINNVVFKNGGTISTIENNIEIGTEIFSNMLKKYNFNIQRTLQAYNGNHTGKSYSNGVLINQNRFIKLIQNIYVNFD